MFGERGNLIFFRQSDAQRSKYREASDFKVVFALSNSRPKLSLVVQNA
ncbi:hypothetical protein BIW11_03061 [Tropilaelaps mercedesae]|uniref:Uncharacterized protein n=1 Tax=Tropilaelaps mercedesae TaxID=418985 RepID=A0A1V9XSS8_9ACAR|nr:hypothetical protein BIW11_03061 [Tropilaelaps mercedesae]